MSAVLHVNGWTVSEVNGEPTVRDTALAEKLGYSETRAIRKLIKRMIDSGSFGCGTPCPTYEKIANGNQVEVFYLTEKQALKVIAKSETKIADAIMDEVIDVFLAYRKGQLQPVLDYEGGKVAHILHGFKHDINPTAFLNVALISKFERMFGEKKVRDFYADLIGVKVDDVKRFSDDVASFSFECVREDSKGFVSSDAIYAHYLYWANQNEFTKVLDREAFLRRFAKFSKGKVIQKRIGGARPRGYTISLIEL